MTLHAPLTGLWRRLHRWSTYAPLLVVLALIMAACGGAAPTKKANPVLVVTMGPAGDYTRTFNPYASGAPGTAGMLYEPLLYFNQLQGTINPWLAASYTLSEDAKRITFILKDGLKWSDGQPLTSEDVVFTFQMLKQYPALDTNNLWGYLQDVTAPDPKTVVLTLQRPFVPALWFAGGNTLIVPKHIWQSVGDPTKFTNPDPVSSGPLKLKSFSPQVIVYQKNPYFWDADKVQVQEVRYPAYTSNTTIVGDLVKGNLDWAGIYEPDLDHIYVARDPQHFHYWFSQGSPVVLYLNLTKYPFNNVQVRQAISLALDRERMWKVAESGYEPVAHVTGLQPQFFKDYLLPQYKESPSAPNVSQASQLLASTGLKKGADGFYVDQNGKPLTFKVNVVSGWTDWVSICQIIADNLKQIGFKVQVQALEYGAYLNALQMGQFDMAVSWSSGGPDPYYYYNGELNSKSTAPVGQKAPSNNFERWMDPETDRLLNQYATSADPAARKEAILGLEKIAYEKLPVIPLVYGANWYEYNTQRFVGWPDQQHPYAIGSPWASPDMAVVLTHLQPS